MYVKNHKGFTLLEAMIVITTSAVLVMAGTLALSSLFGSSGRVSHMRVVDSAGNDILRIIANTIGFQRAYSLATGATTYLRADCVTSGSVEGQTLTVNDEFGQTVMMLDSNSQIASNSMVISGIAQDLTISNLKFTWSCNPTKNDLLGVSFNLTANSASYGNISKDFYTEVNMYNSF